MKRIINLIIALCVVMSLFSTAITTNASESGEYKDGSGFTYHYSVIDTVFSNNIQYSGGIKISNVTRDNYKELDIPKDLVFPETINGVTVTQISPDVISYDTGNIQNIYLSKNIEYISGHSGYNENVSHSFSADSLVNIFVDENNPFYKSIDGVLFSKDGSVIYSYPEGRTAETYEIPSHVTCIGVSAFFSNDALTRMVIPPSVTKISEDAFNYCRNLTDVSLPWGLQSIDSHAFQCTNIKNIVIPDTVTMIGINAFYSCENLEEVRLPASLETLGIKHRGVGIFHECKNLKRLIVPYGVSGLYAINYNNAYAECESLKIFSIPRSVKECTIDALPKNLEYLYFGGSESDWNAMFAEQRKDSDLDKLYRNIMKDCKIFYDADLWNYVYGDAIKILLNDVMIAPVTEPISENYRTLVPLRAVFEAMNMKVDWNGATSTITIIGNGTSITMEVNNTTATVNGKPLTMDVPPRIIDGRTLVPIRFIAESLGAEVNWDESTQTVDIKYTPNPAILSAQKLYDNVELWGGQAYLEERIKLYSECHSGAMDAFSISNDIDKVKKAVGYLTSATINIGTLCVGNVAGFGSLVSTILPGITLDAASTAIEKACDTEESFVALMLETSDTNAYNTFATAHASLNRDIMTEAQAAEYLTRYYEAKFNNETVLMAFKYFASKCPENFGKALMDSAEAAFGAIITACAGTIFSRYNASSLTFDIINFHTGTSISLFTNLGKCNNKIISTWANDIQNIANQFYQDLYGSELGNK